MDGRGGMSLTRALNTFYKKKTMNKSIFLTSNVNSDSIFEFYTKFYVGLYIIWSVFFLMILAGAAGTKEEHQEKLHIF
jgi:hypothetical protein